MSVIDLGCTVWQGARQYPLFDIIESADLSTVLEQRVAKRALHALGVRVRSDTCHCCARWQNCAGPRDAIDTYLQQLADGVFSTAVRPALVRSSSFDVRRHQMRFKAQ